MSCEIGGQGHNIGFQVPNFGWPTSVGRRGKVVSSATLMLLKQRDFLERKIILTQSCIAARRKVWSLRVANGIAERPQALNAYWPAAGFVDTRLS